MLGYNIFFESFIIILHGLIFFSKYENNSELKEKYKNSLYIMGMLQHPYFKDLSYFAEKNSIINLEPLENITELMLKVGNKISIMTQYTIRSIDKYISINVSYSTVKTRFS